MTAKKIVSAAKAFVPALSKEYGTLCKNSNNYESFWDTTHKTRGEAEAALLQDAIDGNIEFGDEFFIVEFSRVSKLDSKPKMIPIA